MRKSPEQEARVQIDAALEKSGWAVQDPDKTNLSAQKGVAVREFPLKKGHGYADYLLFVDGEAIGVVEAKKAGSTLTGTEVQARKYSKGVPDDMPAAFTPLPFLYQSTGVETRFTNLLDPEPRSRHVFAFHRPPTFEGWLEHRPYSSSEIAREPFPTLDKPSTLRSRLQKMPPLLREGLWPPQLRAVQNLEASLRNDRPRSLIQMATGSGKTFAAITAAYRLIKFANATRMLFLVDRSNLGRQAKKEFDQYTTPDDGRKFTELYNVQHLASNKLDSVSRVVITTIQRLYSMLQGKEELPEDLEEGSQFDTMADLVKEPAPVEYNPHIPIEFFDVIFIDEAHRSIYSLWRQVLEYFDAFLIGLTATPAKQTFGFFNQNLVMEYSHPEAVADGVNVDFDVYRIRTRITEEGSKVDAGEYVDKRDRETRALRWQKLDEDLTYTQTALDRDVVATDQIRTVVRTFRDKLFTEIYPGRKEVPKTLVYAKDDSHADDIVQTIREEFGKGNDFCQKITYKTTGEKAEDLIASFRNSYNPRIAVTVDMIATGTDIKPLEIVMFMRTVKSRGYFEQMKGRGVRILNPTDFQAVTPDAKHKDHFVIVDCVGACEQEFSDTYSLERRKSVSLEKLLKQVSFGTTDQDIISSVASRLARIDKRISPEDQAKLTELSRGKPLKGIVADLIESVDPDKQVAEARLEFSIPKDKEPTKQQVSKAAAKLIKKASLILATKPELRQRIIDVKKNLEQTIDVTSKDEVIDTGLSAEAKKRARTIVDSFEKFIEENKDEITALQVLYSRPYKAQLSFDDVKALAEAIQSPPRSWTSDVLWRAYQTLDKSKVRGAGGRRLLTDLVSLVRFALHREEELVPFREHVEERFRVWMAQQENRGKRFTNEQREWIELIKNHIAGSLRIEMEDFDYTPFSQRGGAGKVCQVFGAELNTLLVELNEALAA